jgi:hypothetical protein
LVAFVASVAGHLEEIAARTLPFGRFCRFGRRPRSRAALYRSVTYEGSEEARMGRFAGRQHRDFSGAKFTLAPQTKVTSMSDRVEKLLLAIAPLVTDSDPKDWARFCLVTDKSTIWDFISDNDDIEKLSVKLGIAINGSMFIWRVAQEME